MKLRNYAGRWTRLFAVACLPRYSRHGVVLCRQMMANKNAVKYSCVYCKTLLYLQHALNTFLILLCIILRSRGSVEGIVTGLGAGRFGVRILIRARYSSVFQNVWGPPSPYSEGCIAGAKQPGHDVNHSCPLLYSLWLWSFGFESFVRRCFEGLERTVLNRILINK